MLESGRERSFEPQDKLHVLFVEGRACTDFLRCKQVTFRLIGTPCCSLMVDCPHANRARAFLNNSTMKPDRFTATQFGDRSTTDPDD